MIHRRCVLTGAMGDHRASERQTDVGHHFRLGSVAAKSKSFARAQQLARCTRIARGGKRHQVVEVDEDECVIVNVSRGARG